MLKTMRPAIPPRCWVAALALSACLPAGADTQFRVRKMTRADLPLGQGICEIRLRVDNEVEVSVRGDRVSVHTIAGREARDEGSECNEPLPARGLADFHFEARESRGDIRLLSEPTHRNDYQAIVRIRDSAGGDARYAFRLTWTMTGPGDLSLRERADEYRRDDDLGDRRGGLVWNNTTHFGGPGRGSSTLAGHGPQRLADVSVDIDRGGRIFVSFRTDGARPLTFSGSVIGAEGDTLKADVATDDGVRLRGSMYVSRNPRGDVYRITLDATDGQDRLALSWDRR